MLQECSEHWTKIIWYRSVTPQHGITCWFAILDRVAMKLVVSNDNRYMLQPIKSREQPSYKCPPATATGSKISKWLDISWEPVDFMQWQIQKFFLWGPLKYFIYAISNSIFFYGIFTFYRPAVVQDQGSFILLFSPPLPSWYTLVRELFFLFNGVPGPHI